MLTIRRSFLYYINFYVLFTLTWQLVHHTCIYVTIKNVFLSRLEKEGDPPWRLRPAPQDPQETNKKSVSCSLFLVPVLDCRDPEMTEMLRSSLCPPEKYGLPFTTVHHAVIYLCMSSRM